MFGITKSKVVEFIRSFVCDILSEYVIPSLILFGICKYGFKVDMLFGHAMLIIILFNLFTFCFCQEFKKMIINIIKK